MSQTDSEPDIEPGAVDSAVLDDLNSKEAKSLLDTIDSLRAVDVGQIVQLPQIVVVGDQSSGKSSVLEAISHVRFPAKGDVCTRFATELVLRKASTTNVDVSILSSGSGGPSRTSLPFRKTGLGRDDLPQLIAEATERMEVQGGTAKDFSKDVLRVEITGPDVPSLTLVDLPGFFHSATADQSLQGKRTVDELAYGYMKQENSIILAVVAANAQLAGQIVLEKCLKHDTSRARTLGVITKPDLAPAGSDSERKYLQLAQNKEPFHKLALGWHILRNRAENEDLEGTRDKTEARFLSSGSWAELPPGNKGAATLRKRLSKVLLDHIRKTLPGVISDIEGSLDERTTKLKQLGSPRTSVKDMKTYLIGIAENFQRLVRDGVSGIYGDAFFGDLGVTDRKLRATLRNLNHAFDVVMLTKGASRKILPASSDSGSHSVSDKKAAVGSAVKAPDVPDYLKSFVDCYAFGEPVEVSESDLRKKLRSWAAANQGTEFPGVPNNELVVRLFQEQAQPWRAISRRHIELVIGVVKRFMEELVAHVVGDDDASVSAILRNCIDPFFDERNRVLEDKLEELLAPYEKGYGLPLGDKYRRWMSRTTMARLASRVSNILSDELPNAGKLDPHVISAALSRADDIKGDEFGTETILHMMEAYYEMSRRTFAETVVNLAVESCLVRHVEGILTPSQVNLMEDEEVRSLASESPEVARERELLEGQVSRLKEGLRICRYHKPRSAQALPATLSSRASAKRSPEPSKAAANNTNGSSVLPPGYPRPPMKFDGFNFNTTPSSSGSSAALPTEPVKSISLFESGKLTTSSNIFGFPNLGKQDSFPGGSRSKPGGGLFGSKATG